MSPPPRPPLRAAALLALGWGALVLAPVARSPVPAALGHPLADTCNHLWGYHQVASALLAGRSPLRAEHVGFPEGGALWFIDLGAALLATPLTALGGPALGYNTAIALGFAWAALAAFLLAWEVCRATPAAAVAAVAFGASPHLLAQAHNGISESLSAGWLPFAVWTQVRLWRAPGRGRALAAGLALAACAVGNFYHGLFAGLGALGFAVAALVHRGPRGALLRPLLPWAALPAVALGGPALGLFRATLLAEDALVRRDPEFVRRALVGHNMVDVLAFFTPGRFYSPDLAALFDEALLVVVYVGWLLILPAVWGAARQDRARPWAAAALLSFVFALGPYLYLNGQYVRTPSGGMLPLPFLALFDGLPLFSAISHAFRFVVPLTMCLGVCAALALAPYPRLAAALAPALLAELLLASPAPFPLPVTDLRVPTVYDAIPGEGAVLDLPLTQQVLARSTYNLYQLAHGRPIPYGLNDPTPAHLDHNPLSRALIDAERSSINTSAPTPPLLDLVLGREALAAAGFAAVVVHPDRYPPETLYRVTELLDGVVGPPQEVGGRLLYPLR